MRLRSLCEALLLLCLCAVPSLAAGGQTLAIRRAHQPCAAKDQSSCRALIRRNPPSSKPPLNSKPVVAPRTIAPRKLVHRNAFCRPNSCTSAASGVNGTTSNSKGSAQLSLPECRKWLRALTSLVAVLLLYSA